jgi:hypothetical protein
LSILRVKEKKEIRKETNLRKEATMRKVPLVAVFWVFALALPFTIIALAGVAYINLHFSEMVQAIRNLEQATTAGGRGWVAETAQRLPELAGMVIGMIVIYTIYIFMRKPVEAGYNHVKH